MPLLRWGRIFPEDRAAWSDEFVWSGTRDSSPYLSIPAAIDFFAPLGQREFALHTHQLAQYARQQLQGPGRVARRDGSLPGPQLRQSDCRSDQSPHRRTNRTHPADDGPTAGVAGAHRRPRRATSGLRG